MLDIDLKGQAALVTGGARGIGRAIALGLARAGADVVVNYRKPGGASERPAKELVEEIVSLGRKAVIATGDISNKDEVEEFVDKAVEGLGGLDILILNAARAPFKPFDRLLERDLRTLVDTNFLGNVFTLQKSLGPLSERGGKVVFISSLGSRFYHPQYSLGWMKAAMENVVKSWAEAMADRGVSINAVCAGLVKTDSYRILRRLWPEVAYLRPEAFVEAAEVADVTCFLCSPLARAIRGQTIVVDKGMSNALIRGQDPKSLEPSP